MESQYIIILFLVIVMVLIIYYIEPIFSKEKISNNNEHGSARWSTKKEIQKNFKMEKVNNISESGFPVYYSKDNKKVWFDKQTPHWICLGSTGFLLPIQREKFLILQAKCLKIMDMKYLH